MEDSYHFIQGCASCGYIVPGLGGGDYCSVCGWQQDPGQEAHPDDKGGANKAYSLRELQMQFYAKGDCGPKYVDSDYPENEFFRDPGWRPLQPIPGMKFANGEGICACCGYISGVSEGQECPVCGWVCSRVQQARPRVAMEPNRDLSLSELQRLWYENGESGARYQNPKHPEKVYYRDPAWRPVEPIPGLDIGKDDEKTNSSRDG